MRCLVLIFVLAAGSSNAESVFRCVDGDGKLTFTDRPCKQSGVVVELDDVGASSSYTDPSAEINTALDLVQSSRERHEGIRETEALQAAREEERSSVCQQLAEYKQKLAAGGFFYRRDDAERRALTDDEIAEEVSRLDRELRQNCSS